MRRVPHLSRISVVGSGTHAHRERALPLGRALAELGVHLVTGGGGGVMAEVARAFTGVSPRPGLSIGVVPAGENGEDPPPGYPNPWVELPIHTHLTARGTGGPDPQSRNHLVVLTGQAVISLPGSAGTLSEVELALEYGRPVVAHLGSASDLPGLRPSVILVPSLDEVIAFLARSVGGVDEGPSA